MKTPLPAVLQRHAALIGKFSLPSVEFSLEPGPASGLGTSRLGGGPDLPADFPWPVRNDRKLDFLVQVDLKDLAAHSCAALLPREGLLSFFYDLKDQPWGFDPKDLGFYKVVYSPPGTPLRRHDIPNPAEAVPPAALSFRAGETLPTFGSRSYGQLLKQAGFSDAESDAYVDFAPGPSAEGPQHRLFGHSANVQNDMQLEAQLVTNGLYCGDATGYEDPRAKTLEPGADDWLLLLQLDSDDAAGLMWGDCGMIYYWIRRQDLQERRFDRAWMALQCS